MHMHIQRLETTIVNLFEQITPSAPIEKLKIYTPEIANIPAPTPSHGRTIYNKSSCI